MRHPNAVSTAIAEGFSSGWLTQMGELPPELAVPRFEWDDEGEVSIAPRAEDLDDYDVRRVRQFGLIQQIVRDAPRFDPEAFRIETAREHPEWTTEQIEDELNDQLAVSRTADGKRRAGVADVEEVGRSVRLRCRSCRGDALVRRTALQKAIDEAARNDEDVFVAPGGSISRRGAHGASRTRSLGHKRPIQG